MACIRRMGAASLPHECLRSESKHGYLLRWEEKHAINETEALTDFNLDRGEELRCRPKRKELKKKSAG